jgi:hypothetical protein
MPRKPKPKKRSDSLPSWVTAVVRWLGIATTVIGAVTALLLAVGKFGDAVYAPCKSFPSLPWCSTGTLVLAPYDSPTTDGGHSQREYCEPRAESYRAQHPNFTITWRGSEANHKDMLGHVTYNYHCEFIAVPNGWSIGVWLALGGFAIGLFALLFLWWRRGRPNFLPA